MNPQTFIFDTPLYEWVEFEEDSLKFFAVNPRSNYHPRYDGYNPVSCCDSTYQLENGFEYSTALGENSVYHSDFALLQLACTRKGDLMIILVEADYENMKMRKVGQCPSIADIHIAQIKQYSKVASKVDLRDLTRAIGLAANGIGIGSFVYLRRIFENLINSASEVCVENGWIDKHVFDSSRMDEKISMIKNELPDFLYENRKIYGIISKGIHELTEEECLAMFDVMRSSIEMILEEKLVKHEKELKKKELQKSIEKIASQLASK